MKSRLNPQPLSTPHHARPAKRFGALRIFKDLNKPGGCIKINYQPLFQVDFLDPKMEAE